MMNVLSKQSCIFANVSEFEQYMQLVTCVQKLKLKLFNTRKLAFFTKTEKSKDDFIFSMRISSPKFLQYWKLIIETTYEQNLA